jgi:hypothetical protein
MPTSRWLGWIGIAVASASLSGCGWISSGCARAPDSRLSGIQDEADAQALVGLNRVDILNRFGPDTGKRFDDWDATYWLRPQGLCMDGWYLAIDYDDQQVVESAALLPG